MWKHYISCFYISILIKYVSCCPCNVNHTDLSKGKRQLESLESTATELIESTPATEPKETEISTNTYTYDTTFMDIHETTTETFESIVRIFDNEVNRSQVLSEENNTLENIFDVNENSSEVLDMIHINSINLNKYDAEFFIENETTTEKPKKRPTLKVNDNGERDRKKENDLKKKCAFYKNGNPFKLNKLPGVWQVIYYRLPNKMKCFKINIKMLNKNDQERFARVYGTFNDTVHWNHTFLEITSIDTEYSGRRHFLQGVESEKGVMGNVIIDEEYSGNATFLSLHSEGRDQWLVIRNLLLMRDCEEGDLVVFTRYPKQPRKGEVMEALKKFGEKQLKGTMACSIEKFWHRFEEEKHENHLIRTREDKKYFSKHHNKNITAGVNYH